jgi:hypothetical protein
MAVAEWFPKWVHNYYAKEGALADTSERYTMVNPTSQKAYVTFNLYPNRMFPVGCRKNSAYYSIMIKQGSTRLSYRGARRANNLQINATSTLLAAGTYTVDIRVYGNPGANEIFDFTFKVYSEKGGIVIKDSRGETNEVGVSDHTSCAKEQNEDDTTPTPNGKNSTIPAEFALCCLSTRLDFLEGNEDSNTKFAIQNTSDYKLLSLKKEVEDTKQ